MTVNSTNITSGPYTGNDVTTVFDYDFRIENKLQVKVIETDLAGVETVLTVDTDYTVAGIGDDQGGQITRVAGALPTDFTWYIRSDYKATQQTAFDSQGGFFPDLHEAAMDKLTFLIQQLQDIDDRSFRLDSDVAIDGTFTIDDDAAARQGRYLGFDGSGNLVVQDLFDLGVIPLQSARQTGDGVNKVFTTSASVHVDPISLMVFRDGVRQRPDTDYTTTSAAIGQLTFVTAPDDGAAVDIMLFEPNTFNPGGFVTEAPVDGNQYTRKDAAWTLLSVVSTFLGLTDAPSSYTGQGAKLVAVKVAEDGVEFVDAPAGGLTPDFTQTGTLADGDLFMAESSVARTRALPPGVDGARIGIKDDTGSAATNTITIQPNGAEKIAGVAADLTITSNFGYAELVYKAADSDWRLVV